MTPSHSLQTVNKNVFNSKTVAEGGSQNRLWVDGWSLWFWVNLLLVSFFPDNQSNPVLKCSISKLKPIGKSWTKPTKAHQKATAICIQVAPGVPRALLMHHTPALAAPAQANALTEYKWVKKNRGVESFRTQTGHSTRENLEPSRHPGSAPARRKLRWNALEVPCMPWKPVVQLCNPGWPHEDPRNFKTYLHLHATVQMVAVICCASCCSMPTVFMSNNLLMWPAPHHQSRGCLVQRMGFIPVLLVTRHKNTNHKSQVRS